MRATERKKSQKETQKPVYMNTHKTSERGEHPSDFDGMQVDTH